ncbi:acyl-CoA desaturase [Granulicella tundricola]|uniref:Stearoyl-CoA 9-desaturase n=1 Tax=Granulicella tundricola (strain ATCC BAA-1859 / DSM 23138 / MP5ACTX9) TaxID=1198114 RepID=E8WYB0_GRATM|nr:Stearoyl-CoA 9-desaturase [Granulicella tundricola MP5ACTX9]
MTPATLTPESEATSTKPGSYAEFQAQAIETGEANEAALEAQIQDMSNAKPAMAADKVRAQVKQDLRLGREHQQGRINWITTIAMGAFHVFALVALLPIFWSWKNVSVFFVMYFLAINVGIGVAYHRLLTHRGFRTPKWVEYFVTACGTMALEGGPIFWVATHRVHHQNSDQEGDPHTPVDGTFWSHAGWILSGRAMHSETALLGRYAPDLTKDKVHVLLSKYHWVLLTATGVAQLALGAFLAAPGHRVIGAVGMMLWGTMLRVVVGLHATWFVNSATHLYGARRFDTRDDSRNNWWVAILTGGEGWHNNHHAHPVSARHGLAWYEFDINYYCIWILSKIGLAKKVQIAKFDWENPKPAGVN